MKHTKEPWNYIGEEAIPCPEQMGDNEWVEGKSQSLPGFGFQDLHQEIEDMFRDMEDELGRPPTEDEKRDAYGDYMAYQNNRNGKS